MLIARTTTHEATIAVTTDTKRQMGYDPIKFSTHYPTYEVFAPVQGHVFSVSGNDKRFPALSSVPGFDKGFKTIHPNCRYVLVITVKALWTDEGRSKYLADAGKPLRGDTRTQAEIDRYNAMQAEKRDRWQYGRQWEKYKAVMGDEAPKTFSGFRAIKRFNDRWKALQGFYRYKLDNPTARRVHYDIYRELKVQGIDRGKVILFSEKATPYTLADNDARNPYHVMRRMMERGVTDADINKVLASSKSDVQSRDDTNRLYFSEYGAVAIIMKGDDWIVKTVWSKDDFNEVMETMLRTVNKYV